MSWRRMLFRGAAVFVRVGDDGRLALDGDGRAEMKYREGDTKSYRPAPANLAPLAGGDAPAANGTTDGGQRAAAAGRARPHATRKPAAPALPRAGTAALEVWTD